MLLFKFLKGKKKPSYVLSALIIIYYVNLV